MQSNVSSITKTITESLEEYEKNLDEWLENEDHRYKCASWNEGLNCCLDKQDKERIYGANGRGFSKSHFLQSQIRLIEAVIEEMKKSLSSEHICYANLEYCGYCGKNCAIEDQISSLNETLEFIKKSL